MKRPTDTAKWSGEGFTPDVRKPREPWAKRMAQREREFDKAPVETLLTMARVAGNNGAFVGKIYKWDNRGNPFTRCLAVVLTAAHTATWSPEAGIKVVSRQAVDRLVVW